MVNKAKSGRPRRKKLEVDEALIALFIGAMDANHHVAREELARAHICSGCSRSKNLRLCFSIDESTDGLA